MNIKCICVLRFIHWNTITNVTDNTILNNEKLMKISDSRIPKKFETIEGG